VWKRQNSQPYQISHPGHPVCTFMHETENVCSGGGGNPLLHIFLNTKHSEKGDMKCKHFSQLPFSTRWLKITFTYLKIYSLVVNKKKKNLYSAHANNTCTYDHIHDKLKLCILGTADWSLPTRWVTEPYLLSDNHLSSTHVHAYNSLFAQN